MGWAGVTTNFEYGFSASAMATYENVNYRGGNHENYWKGDLGVQYQLSKYVSFQAGYTYQKDSTNYAADFSDNIISISGSLRF
jgi:predicted porin